MSAIPPPAIPSARYLACAALGVLGVEVQCTQVYFCPVVSCHVKSKQGLVSREACDARIWLGVLISAIAEGDLAHVTVVLVYLVKTRTPTPTREICLHERTHVTTPF